MPDYHPFFIVGHPRSGTTLLRMILCGHSNLFIPEETGFIPFLKVDPSKTLTKHDVGAVINRIKKLNYYWRDLPLTSEQIFQSLGEQNLPALLDFLYQLQTQPDHATRWGDKTPLYVQYMDNILEIFPKAQFIHIIRDGRDAALSALVKWGDHSRYMDLDYLLRNWVRNVTKGCLVGRSLTSHQYHEIRYENLVIEPEQTLLGVCRFLNEQYEPDMLDQTKVAQRLGPGPDNHYETLHPINTRSLNRWKKEFSSFENKKSIRIAGELLSSLEYEIPIVEPMTVLESVQYGLTTTRFMFFDTARSFLYSTGYLTLNKTMRKPN